MSIVATEMPRTGRRAARTLAALGALVLFGCSSSAGAPPASTTTPLPVPASSAAPQGLTWTVRPREHVDLWLHGLAMLMDDTARVPLFRRGYRDEMRATRTRAGVTTRLDAERDRLRERFGVNPSLPLDAQFVPFAFESWDTLRRAVDYVVQSGGNPQRAGDQETARAIAILANVFRTPADREWLRVFAGALDDEYARFYRDYWAAQQRDRAATLAAIRSEWDRLGPRVQRFLLNTQQRGGEIVPSLPLGGEGRTQSGGPNSNLVAVSFPSSPAAAAEALYTAVHEFVGSTAGPIVTDNVSPADQRAGLADRYVSAAQVRGGLMLLQKTAPDLAAGYARYYLATAGASAGGDPVAALTAAFPLPQPIADALAKQIDVVLGGI
ncbi:hypothetical protein J421_2368 [Gemmatirosa kalamazoonensis]|uniref:Lipoprotein n=1 Tax=Gemmatirosa kalamazoonensis TaxID=861299 RepID=W0RHU8_9BACT|nr:hypothetical protein [Gemmatirosa kalamazoonensis]AHG89905.1 hypothetical protein J421_2368 [Gemmatirosa kalamazoonensis]